MSISITSVYDGRCVICRASKAFVETFDWRHRVEFLDLHESALVTAHYPTLDHDAAMGEVHVYDQHGREFAGFLGTRRMLKEMPVTFPIWVLLQLPGMTSLGSRLYRWIARNRYAVNRLFGVDLTPCEDDVCKV